MPTRWTYGRPKISKIEILNFNLNTFSRDLLKCDIGLVPNISDNTPLFKKQVLLKACSSSDYFFRMKNKSNSGRMFVFIQHGIPVIADLTSSNIHILGNPDNGFAVFSKDGWLNALNELSNSKTRKMISKNALKDFNKLYNPIEWTKKLSNKIQKF